MNNYNNNNNYNYLNIDYHNTSAILNSVTSGSGTTGSDSTSSASSAGGIDNHCDILQIPNYTTYHHPSTYNNPNNNIQQVPITQWLANRPILPSILPLPVVTTQSLIPAEQHQTNPITNFPNFQQNNASILSQEPPIVTTGNYSHQNNTNPFSMESNTLYLSIIQTNNYQQQQSVIQPSSTNLDKLTNTEVIIPLANATIINNYEAPPTTVESNKDDNLEQRKTTGPFKCKKSGCDRNYTTISGLNNHIRKIHSGSALYHCDECTEYFPSTHERTMHKIQLHDGRRYSSVKTSKKILSIQPSATITSSSSSSSKSSTTTEDVKYKCSIENCDKEFRKLINFEKHKLIHHHKGLSTESDNQNHDDNGNNQQQQHKCETCNDLFNQRSDLLRHIRNRHTGSGDYPCPECSKVFFTLDMYTEHRSLHDKTIPKYTCSECDKEFINERKLREHSIIHKERTMFKCDVCKKVFVRSQTLQYHRITCKAAYPCEHCVDSFMTIEALQKHMVFHKNDNFTCTKCNKVFPTKKILLNHEKRHALRMNYTCQICKEAVSTRAKFQKHIRDHLENNLKCSVCNEEFQSLVKYGYHKAEKHSIMRPYDCILCTDEFCTRHELFMHLHNHIDTNTSSNTFTCEKCNMKFSIKATYEQHQKSHFKDDRTSSTSSSSCEIQPDLNEIDEDNLDNVNMETNSNTTTTTTTATATINPNISMGSKSIEIQKPSSNIELNNYEIECTHPGCEQKFTNLLRLRQHSTVHSLKTYECRKCHKIYHSDIVYEKHISLCQTNDDDLILIADHDIDSGPVNCEICQQLFENQKVLKYHRKFCTTNQTDYKNSTENHNLHTNQNSIEEVYVKSEFDDELLNLVPEL